MVEVTQAGAKSAQIYADFHCEDGSFNVTCAERLAAEFDKVRTEAEARGRLEALEEIKKWLRSPEGKGSDAGIDYADGFADQIERMMTGGK